MAIQFKNLVDVFEQRTGAIATDAYTLTVSTEQTSGATPNPGTGGLKVQYYSVSSGTTHGFGLVAGSSSSDFLTSGPMHFYTNSDLDTKNATGFAMVLDTSQRLGIGTTNPASRLQVNTTTDINAQLGLDSYGSFKLGDILNNYLGRGIFYDATPGNEDLDILTSTFNIAGDFGEGIKVVSSGDVQLSSPAGVVLTINGTTNNVGIGTSSPVNKLDVVGDIGIDESIIHNGDVDTKFGFVANDNFAITTNGTERVRVTSGGSVGIATNNPSAKLDVEGNAVLGSSGNTATGSYAVALNQNNTAISLDALATGENTTASGRQSFSGGFNTTASGDASFAHGATTLAQGTNSFAAGAETEAIGTGAAAFNNQTNAIGINSFAIGGNTTASGEASFASGVSTLSQGIGSVSSGLSTNAAANGTHVSGVASTATGLFSSAQGDNCLAQGQASIAMGYIAEARGNFGSAAIGFNVDANGQSSLAVNQQNVAQGVNSIAGGFQTNIDSNESMGMGFHCKSQASTLVQNNQFLFGRYLNAPQSNPSVQAGQSQFIVGRHNAYQAQQHTAFAVGNGSGIGTESNAMTVLYNGRVGIGTTAPTSTLHVIGDITSSSGALFGGNTEVQGSLQVGDNVGGATAASAGSIRYRTTSNSSHVDMVMQTGASTYAWVNIVTNTW